MPTFAELNEKIAGLEEEKRTLTTLVEGISSARDALAERNQGLEAKVSSLEGRVQALHNVVNNISDKVWMPTLLARVSISSEHPEHALQFARDLVARLRGEEVPPWNERIMEWMHDRVKPVPPWEPERSVPAKAPRARAKKK